MKIATTVYLSAALVFLTGCVSGNEHMSFDKTHPAHPLAEIAAVYSTSATLTIDPLSRLDESVDDPVSGTSHMNHQIPHDDAKRYPCHRKGKAQGTSQNRLEVDHGSSRNLARRGDRKAGVVCITLED